MKYISSGKSEGATVHVGGSVKTVHGSENYIQPTIFTDTTPEMKIVNEEIFGPVAVLVKFKTEEGMYGTLRIASMYTTAFSDHYFCRGD